ncbi:DUF86 domain-containing protein [bacterium]|nr:DUF86 domain-containing protein [bacterium]
MKDNKGDLIRLHHILDAMNEIESYVDDKDEHEFQTNTMLQSACIRQLEIIGEAANRLSEKLREKSLNDWREIIGLRNILIHEYFGVDLSIIWQIIKIDLPNLKNKIQLIIQNLTK